MPKRRKSASASSASSSKRSKSKKAAAEENGFHETNGVTADAEENGVTEINHVSSSASADTTTTTTTSVNLETRSSIEDDEDRFIGEPLPPEDAKARWPHRYTEQDEKVKKNQGARARRGGATKGGREDDDDEDVIIQARCHYTRAVVDGNMHYELFDDAHVFAGQGKDPHICRIIEMFEALDGTPHVTCQWYYRAKDTDINEHWEMIDKKRVFLSEVKTDNPLGCLCMKLKIVKVKLGAEKIPTDCDYYYNMMYFLPYSSFVKVAPEVTEDTAKNKAPLKKKSPLSLLDMYAGCGGMSTGLCLGSKLAGSDLITRWAVDINECACKSLRVNHPETEVRNEAAENFLALLKEWRRLCATFSLISDSGIEKYSYFLPEDDENISSDATNDSADSKDSQVFEVDKILDVCYGDPNKNGKDCMHLKVHWKGYRPEDDTWEPLDGLSNCDEVIKKFVVRGYNSKRLPLPGEVDIVCGGPPCQGISGFNRFRNTDSPLDDPKNKQLVVFMDIVDYLKPRFVLMENVVDILKFKDGYLGGYALGRLIGMNYQARTGILAAGCYGLPQFRMRFFLWGAYHTEILPQYPLPTHDVVTRGGAPVKAEKNLVAYDQGHKVELKKLLLLGDAISDLPPVTSYDEKDEMPYLKDPETDFQRHIRSNKNVTGGLQQVLYDHRSLALSSDDYQRVQKIPKKKGANFRDLEGVRVDAGNRVYFDPNMERIMLPSGKPLVPNYAMRFDFGRSSKPFGRLWWDETVPTVVTRAEPHNQVILHPEQDRVLTIRENARLQGFPDYYKLCGSVKERYIQVGNAVAVPVGTALGYALGLAFQGTANSDPVLTLPDNFPNIDSDSDSP